MKLKLDIIFYVKIHFIFFVIEPKIAVSKIVLK